MTIEKTPFVTRHPLYLTRDAARALLAVSRARRLVFLAGREYAALRASAIAGEGVPLYALKAARDALKVAREYHATALGNLAFRNA